jgi:hypothetical protein
VISASDPNDDPMRKRAGVRNPRAYDGGVAGILRLGPGDTAWTPVFTLGRPVDFERAADGP